MANRQEKVGEYFRELAAEFLQRESNQQSLITVTGVRVSQDLRRATVYITILPEEKEKAALDFAKRKRKDLREFVKERTRLRVLPFLDVEIDKEQKVKQKLQELL